MGDFDKAMAEVLKQGKYNVLTGRAFDWREHLYRLLSSILNKILERLRLPELARGADIGTDVLIHIFMAVAIAVALAIVGAILFFLYRRRKRQNSLGEAFADIDRTLTASDLLRLGRESAALSQVREAVRYCFAALLLSLNSRGVIRIGYAKTNGQLRRELRNRAPDYSPEFDKAVMIFDLAWFGHKDIQADRFQQFQERVSELIRQVETVEIKP
jgi:hypothetical protein